MDIIKLVRREPISTMALILSLGVIAYDNYYPTEITTGSLSVVGGGTTTIGLGIIAAVIFATTLIYLAVKR